MPEPPTQVRVLNFRSLILWALCAFLLIEFLHEIAITLLIFALAILFAIALDPPIRWLDRRGLSRGMSVGLIALLILVVASIALSIAIPPLVREAQELFEQLPAYSQRLQAQFAELTARYPPISDAIRAENLQARIGGFVHTALPQVGRYSLNVINGFISLLLIVVLTLYIVADPTPLVHGLVRAVPREHRRAALRLLARIIAQVQAWVRATFWMMLIVGLMCGIGLWLLGVRSPLLFGVIAAIGEAIPSIGPILSAIPPFLVTLADDPQKAMGVLVLFLVVQQIENNILVPRIMASTLKLHSVSVMFFVIAMGSLIGPVGILLATPLCAIVKALYEELYLRRMRDAEATPRRGSARQSQTQ